MVIIRLSNKKVRIDFICIALVDRELVVWV